MIVNLGVKRIIGVVGLISSVATSLLVLSCNSSAQSKAQADYLDAVRHRNAVQARIQSDPATAWTELRSLAAEMKRAEEEELSKLEAGAWPPNAEAAIAELMKEIRLALPYWQKAAEATTPDEVYSNIDTAFDYCGGPAAGKVRTALGLPQA